MRYLKVQYTIKPGVLDQVRAAINKLVADVKENEIGVLSYDVYWEEPTRRFTHLITYLDDVADEIHRNEPHLIEFVTKMHPLGEIDPKPTIIETLRGHVPSGAVLFASTKQLNDKEGERES
ncbi:MAG: hypothetical protein H6684_01600 [Deltaproteobacteria bacterium]|nr:hypothetical protein [Deltaproteobacteria bacterium]MCB9487407.1 hypothetical protein [Deltaproteobacteria bacterium]